MPRNAFYSTNHIRSFLHHPFLVMLTIRFRLPGTVRADRPVQQPIAMLPCAELRADIMLAAMPDPAVLYVAFPPVAVTPAA